MSPRYELSPCDMMICSEQRKTKVCLDWSFGGIILDVLSKIGVPAWSLLLRTTIWNKFTAKSCSSILVDILYPAKCQLPQPIEVNNKKIMTQGSVRMSNEPTPAWMLKTL
jgi:hypothetical protein